MKNKKIYTFLIYLLIILIPIKVYANSITFNQSQIIIGIGDSETLKYNLPSGTNNNDIIWSSTNQNVATVNSSGKVTAISKGETIITALLNGTNATCKVIVVDITPLTNISLNKTSVTIKETASETLSITYTPSNATNKKISWKSSNSNIVTVDSNGKITGIKSGTATITAISKDGGYTAKCTVTVEAITKKVTSISLNKKELNINVGETFTLTETISPNDAENKKVTWSSNNEKIAKVKDGIITALSPGEAEIKVVTEDGKKEAICKVKVIAPTLNNISFQETTKTVYKDSETKLTVIKNPDNASIENLLWTSSDETVATVENGLVKAKKIGTTLITLSNEDKSISATINITVIEKPKEPLNITVENYNLNFSPDIKNYTLKIGSEKKLIINTNRSEEKVTINGNQNLENGSIITITVNEKEKVTYIIEIKKTGNYAIYFIAIISVLLLINLIRIFIKNKKKSK